MREKWRDERGETLVEAVAAVLIMTLAVLLLFSTVIVSVRINKSVRNLDEEFYAVLNAAEAQSVEITDVTIVPAGSKVKVEQKSPEPTGTTTMAMDAEVDFYGGKGALSYGYPPPAGP